MVAAATESLGVPVVAAISDGDDAVSVSVATGLGHAVEFSIGREGLQPAVDRLAAKTPSVATMLIFGGSAVSAGTLRHVLAELGRRFPGTAVAGSVALPLGRGGEGSTPMLWPGGRAPGPGEVCGLMLGARARVAMHTCGFEPFGPELEVFEATLRHTEYGLQQPHVAVIRQIGTDEEGDIAEHTHPGCSIPRRKGLAAAAAVREAMQVAGVGSPKEVWIGVPGVPRSGRTPTATTGSGQRQTTWALFPWVAVTDGGGVALGGRGPAAEGLVPKADLQRVQCFRTLVPGGGPRAGAAVRGGSGGGLPGLALLLASPCTPPGALVKLAQTTGAPTALRGTAVLGGTPAAVNGRALVLVVFEGH